MDRPLAKEIMARIEEIVNAEFKGLVTVKGASATISSTDLTVRIKIQDTTSTGELKADVNTQTGLKISFELEGIKVEGDPLPSVWKKGEKLIKLIDYAPKRPKYPLIYSDEAGKKFKCNFNTFRTARQITQPTLENFHKWITIDPDSDAVLETDVTICDDVADYLDTMYADTSSFPTFVDHMNELMGTPLTKATRSSFKDVYDALFTQGVDAALKQYYKHWKF